MSDRRRRYAGDFSHLSPIDLGIHLPPDYNKDLPRIPSNSTGLWDSEAVTVFTSLSGTLTTSPNAGCPPPPVPSPDAYQQVPLTEAQQIAAQYRQRHRSSSDVLQNSAIFEQTVPGPSSNPLESQRAFPSSTVTQSSARVDGHAIDPAIGGALAPCSPTIRRSHAEEMKTPHETVSRFSRVHDDGTVSCTREGRLKVSPNSSAFLDHLDAHLVHEGCVARLWRALIWTRALTMLP